MLVLFYIENSYDFGIGKSEFKDKMKWKLHWILKNNIQIPLYQKLSMSLDLLKGEYIYLGKNYKVRIPFEKYVDIELREDSRKLKQLFSDLEVYDFLITIFHK